MTSFEEYESMFVGGHWIAPTTSRRMRIESASTKALLATVPTASEEDVDRAVQAARTAVNKPGGWADWEPNRRAAVLVRLAEILERKGEQTATYVSAQNGMPISLSRQFEATLPAAALRYYASLVEEIPREELRPGIPFGSTLVRRNPVGVVAAIVPWNLPQILSMFKLAPALAVGCAVVLKPAPETVLDAYVLAQSVEEAGFPSGVVSIIPGDDETGSYLVSHPGVDKVSFTGSTAVGRRIAADCGQLLRPVTLELGGKSAAIILDDADLSGKAEQMFAASFINNGQTCFASTRILAPRSRYREIVDFYAAMADTAHVGDALEPSTQIGPLVSSGQRERVESYIEQGLRDGALLAAGGGRPKGLDEGWFVEPTIFYDVDNSTRIAQEEIFGPVLSIIPYSDDEDAIRLANASVYGLGGTVWSTDLSRALEISGKVKTGTIGINGYVPDMGAPFGGLKASGLGRELGPEGLQSYEYLQSVYQPDAQFGR
ncbi:aldehyde dehydrogenase [Streptomyces sp. NPDC059215]|uniref:aldehyde dehydrogenase n=1 Tax=Streptomyces sp. NPDC059215 TaxID=3346772 RepID=UPI0036A6D3A0